VQAATAGAATVELLQQLYCQVVMSSFAVCYNIFLLTYVVLVNALSVDGWWCGWCYGRQYGTAASHTRTP
jgi:hypothetical protein